MVMLRCNLRRTDLVSELLVMKYKNMLDIVVIGSRRATFQHFLGSVTCQLKIFVTFQQSHPFIELHNV